jgi:large subunit ribosomal protein L29
MKARELRQRSVNELEKELISLQKARFGHRMQVATQQATNVSESRKLRRDVARVKTVLREKSVQK